MTDKIIRCAIYTRKSSDEGLEQAFNSLDAQREACEAYIKSQASEGWSAIAERFDDGGFSGGDMERPALQKLIGEIKRKRVQVIVVYKIDRLTRSLADFARLVEILDANGASFVSVTQAFNTTTSMGRLTLNVLLSFAQFEREVTSERIRDKIGASKRRGLWMGGYPPLGYDIVNRRLAVNEQEALNVRTIFELALEERSLTKLARAVAKRGLKAKAWKTQGGAVSGGGAHTRTSLHRLLRNPVYIGKIRQGGRLYRGEQDAIIDEALWNTVQARLDDARQGQRRARANAKSKAPLLGLLYDDAGNRMGPTSSQRNGLVHRYYCSTPKLRSTSETVGSISRVNAPRIERAVFEAMKQAGVSHDGAGESESLAHIEKIILRSDEIEIHLADDQHANRVLRIPADLASARSAKRSLEHDGAGRREPSLIRAVALAHDWAGKLEAGVFRSATELGEANGFSERYVWKILRLAFLAPDIVEAILDGRQPVHLTLRRINETKLSLDWRAQRETLSFAARASEESPASSQSLRIKTDTSTEPRLPL